MSFKKYIDQIKSLQKPLKPIIKQTRHSLGQNFDRAEAVELKRKSRERYIPPIDFATASNFARFGSAEEYYTNAINRIIEYFPYDGTIVDKEKFHLSSSLLENHIFEHEYPRTNGHVIFSSEGWSTQNATNNGYGEPTTKQYILFNGGLRVGNVVNDTDFTYNLRFGHTGGNCVEFWLNKSEFLPALTEKEVILDIWNSSSVPSDTGRFTVELTSSTNVINVLIASGTNLAQAQLTAIPSSSLVDNTWHHVALNFTYGASVSVESYLDGVFQGSQQISTAIGAVTGNFVGTLGSLVTSQTGTTTGIGWGKLSGSIDEFRFWRGTRTAEQIGIFSKQSLDGGAATGSANINLGVYYKFNEGITADSGVDKNILDYSGRLNNGTFTGYVSSARSTSSAFVLSGISDREYLDPILYKTHPSVSTYLSDKVLLGRVHDTSNNNSVYNTLPSWITDEDQERTGELKKLTQILASYLDELYIEIQTFPNINRMEYYKDEIPNTKFTQYALNSRGFLIGNILQNEEQLVNLYATGDRGEFLFRLEEVKRIIYNNIYNNSTEIFKMKGTTEALRNTLRCFGVDNELINLSIYEDNSIINLDDKRELYEEKYKFLNFSYKDSHNGVIYPKISSSIGAPFISGTYGAATNIEAVLANTYECQIFLPEPPEYGLENPNIDFVGTTTNLFGVRGVSVSSLNDDSTTTLADDGGFVVQAVRKNLIDKRVKFVLTSSNSSLSGNNALPTLETEYFEDSYDNESWNLSVTIKPIGYGFANIADSLQTGTGSYVVEFRGYNVEDQSVLNSFYLSSSIHSERGLKLLSQNRKPFIGAYAANLTGSMTTRADVNVGFFRMWLDALDNNELISHAKDPRNFGRTAPFDNFLPLSSDFSGSYVPKINSLVFNVGTELLESSDTNGNFYLPDLSSGSYKTIGNEYLDTVLDNLYPFYGYGFPASSTEVYKTRYFTSGKNIDPENFGDLTGVNILNEDDLATKSILKANLAYFTIEKSLQQAINRDILSFFSSISGFNELIGNPINKYRMEYKELKKLATQYFSTVESKRTAASYFEYYKWLDNSINDILLNLLPGSLNGSEKIFNVVESHILERNKYNHKLPTIEFKFQDPEGPASGSNNVEWKFAHAPLSQDEKDNCYWWKYKAERNITNFPGSPSDVLSARESIKTILYNTENRKTISPIKEQAETVKTLHGGINFNRNKKVDFYKSHLYTSGTAGFDTMQITASSVISPVSCNDDAGLITKKKLAATVTVVGEAYKFDLVTPGNLVSQSIGQEGYLDNNYNTAHPSHIVTNIHHDVFGSDSEQPLQGTFTHSRVGGSKSRKRKLTDTSERIERFKFDLSSADKISIKSARADAGYSEQVDQFYQDPPIRSSINIKNIKTSGSSVGNFDFNYEVVQTSGKKYNNFAKDEALDIPDQLPSPYVSGTRDYIVFTGSGGDSVIVERFSAPGGPETSGEGLDPINKEYSPYNDVNVRNLNVRQALNSFLIIPSSFGGYQSGSNDLSASFHKVQRNGRKEIRYTGVGNETYTASIYDNGFVTENIPARDFGYSWISRSAPTATNLVSLVGFASSSSDISFFSSSERVFYSGDTNKIINFAGYTTPAEYSTNLDFHYTFTDNFTLQAPPVFYVVNAAIITGLVMGEDVNVYFSNVIGNGPYGWSTWRQIRSERNPITRNLKKNNIFSQELDPIISSKGSDGVFAKQGGVIYAVEPALISGNPVLLNMDLEDDGTKNSTLFAISHNTDKQYILDQGLTKILLSQEQKKKESSFDKFYEFYSKPNQDILTTKNVLTAKYSTQIYPLQKYSFLKNSLIRSEFFQTWTDSRYERSLLYKFDRLAVNSSNPEKNNSRDKINQMGFDLVYFGPNPTATLQFNTDASGDQIIPSIAVLDTKFLDETNIGNTFNLLRVTQSVGGIEFVDLRGATIPGVGSVAYYDITASANMSYGILRDPKSVLRKYIAHLPSGNLTASLPDNGISGVPHHTYGPLLEMPNINSSTKNIDYDFFIKWESPVELGLGPSYYNKHLEFSEYVKVVGKDYSLIPEYRISNHINSFYNGNLKIQDEEINSLEITGSSIGTTAADIRQYFGGDIQLNLDNFSLKMIQSDKIATKFRLKIDSITKLLPYEGFYPAERTVQIAQIFSSTLAPLVSLDGTDATFRTMMQPFFMPGILYNSIKAGIAQSYFFFKDTYSTVADSQTNDRIIGALSSANFQRIKFEELLTFENIRSVGRVFDMYPHQSMSMDSTASIGNVIPPQYQLAISNFLASTIDFCLLNNNLTTAYSSEEKDLSFADNTQTYGMEISLSVSTGSGQFASFVPWYIDPAHGGWGPAVSGSARPGDPLDKSTDWVFSPQWGFGSSSIRIEWNPTQNIKYTIADIQNQLTSTFTNSKYGLIDYSDNILNNLPNLSESINYLGRAQLKQGEVDPKTGQPIKVIDPLGTDKNVWTIQPKWETPFLVGTTYDDELWKNLLNNPGGEIEFQLALKDIDGQLSLREFLRFPDKINLGKLSNTSKIEEAIICIPYRILNNGTQEFFTIDRIKYKSFIEKANTTLQSNEWSNLTAIMEKYVFPPRFDFLKNLNIKPLGMLYKEYSTEISERDIERFWQNLPMDKMGDFDINTDYVEFDIQNTEMFNGWGKIGSTIKWIIFKVKKRAKTNYFAMTAENPLNVDFAFDVSPSYKGTKYSTENFSYNYPYDFCSLVETAKITAEVDFVDKTEASSD